VGTKHIEWKVFWNFDMKKFIIDLFENEDNIKDLMDMVSLFVMQVAKKDDNLYPLIIDINTFNFNFNLLFVTIQCYLLLSTIVCYSWMFFLL
jgi:hypothetical protein